MTESDLLNRLEHINTNHDLFELLKESPPDNWIKQHPEIASYRYLPIDKCEFLLRAIFGFNYRIEVLDTKELFNATSVTVRVHFREKNTPFNWYFHDGVGSDAPKKKDSEFIAYSVAASLPIAKSNAIKDACDHFGILFGSDLNRIDTISNTPKDSDEKKLAELKKEYEKKKSKIDFDGQLHIDRIIEDKETFDYQKIINQLKEL